MNTAQYLALRGATRRGDVATIRTLSSPLHAHDHVELICGFGDFTDGAIAAAMVNIDEWGTTQGQHYPVLHGDTAGLSASSTLRLQRCVCSST